MMWVAGFIILLLLAGFFYASYSIRAGIYVKAYCQVQTSRKIVALTFDDGPDAANTPLVLDVLKKYGVKAAFFCIGVQGEKNPEILKRIVDEGHLIGNHSWSHASSFPLFSRARMEQELRQTSVLIESVTCQQVTLFRPPFGVTNPTLAQAVKKTGMRVIGWSIRSLDTKGEPSGKVFRRIKRQLKPGAVILLHDRLPQSAGLLDMLLAYLKDEEYQVVRIDNMFDL